MKITIEEHSTIDKHFDFYNDYWYARVDYDDVNHEEVDAATEYIKELLEKHWNEYEFKDKLRTILIARWYENAYDLQEEYENLEDYLKQSL